jgi:4-aminobutyrate aminotransferase-like enzyme
MTEYVSYPDLLRFAVDPSSLYSSQKSMKLKICQTTGVNLYLANNARIMDFTAGMRGINLGHNHPKVLSAVAKQMEEYARSAGFFNSHKLINQLWESFLSFIDPRTGSVYITNTEEEALGYAILLAHSITKRSTVNSRAMFTTHSRVMFTSDDRVGVYHFKESFLFLLLLTPPFFWKFAGNFHLE